MAQFIFCPRRSFNKPSVLSIVVQVSWFTTPVLFHLSPNFIFVRFEIFTAVTMKNAVFWDMKPLFVLHSRHIKSPLQSTAR
jgi:hypothetical protein